MSTTEISLPSELAEVLIEEGMVRRGLRERGDWVGYATLAVEGVSALATVIVSWDDLKSLVARFVGGAREQAGDQPTFVVVVKVGAESSSLVEANDDAGVERMEIQISTILAAGRPSQDS